MEIDNTLLLKYLQQELSDNEAEQVEQWIQESPENRREMEEFYSTWMIARSANEMESVDVEASLADLKERIRTRNKWYRHLNISLSVKIAASLIGFILLGGGIWWFTTAHNTEYIVMTEQDNRAHTILPDGSHVWLNKESKLTYSKKIFNKDRSVSLSGEAYFEVAHDDSHPFVVDCRGIKINVLGTHFNVRSLPNEQKVTSTLYQGSIKMTSGEEEYLLQPGQSLTLYLNKHKPRWTAAKSASPIWHQNEIVYNRSALQNITDTLEQLYNVRVVYLSPALRKETYTCRFSTTDSLKSILEVLALTNHFSYTIKEDVIYLKKK